MKLVMKISWQLSMKKETIKNRKKVLEWWIVKEVIQEKLTWLKNVKKIGIHEIIKRNKIINDSLKSNYKTMSSYCLNSRKNKKNINSRVSNTSNGKTMLLSKCAICGAKKTRFIEKQEKEY